MIPKTEMGSKFISSYDSVGEVNGAESAVGEILHHYSSETALKSVKKSDLSEIIYRSERVALSCRNALEMSDEAEDLEHDFDTKTVNESYQDGAISVSFSDNTLRIKTPFTFKKFHENANRISNYTMMIYIRNVLIKWQKENNIDLYRLMKAPVTVFIIRKGPAYNPRKICDNDNLENGRIINEIFSALGYSDNAVQADLFSCFRAEPSRSDFGMEFVVFPQSEILAHIAEIYPLQTGSN